MKENVFRVENLFFTLKKDTSCQAPIPSIREKGLGKKSAENRALRIPEYLNRFWNRLVVTPRKLDEKPSSPISEILPQEKKNLADRMIVKVLSAKLKLTKDSAEILKAKKESTKIFHEDFPGDFILEYNGTRLGLFLLDTCYDADNNATQVYKFRSDLKSFNGLC